MLHIFRESLGKYIAIAILGLLAVTFIFFGIDFSGTRSSFAAKVNGTDIPLLEFERELQQYQTQYQQIYRAELTEDLRRELRSTVVDQMVLREALRQQSESAGYRVSDERLARSLRETPAFQVGGQFSVDTYQARLRANGLTPEIYEVQQRDSLALVEFQEGIAASTFLTPAEYRRYIELVEERREIAYALFEVGSYLDQAEIQEEEIAEHYADNQNLYLTPESVDIEYIELDLASIADGIDISEDELREYYGDVQERYATAEERKVSHILITVDGDDYQSGEADAASVIERLNSGEDFVALAAEVSDDGGTSSQGGDLGWIARGVLTGPFEDTLYSMELGAIAGPVETEFGYHVLRLDDIRSGEVQPYEAVRDEIRAEVGEDRATAMFYDRANELRQSAFDAYDELASVAASGSFDLKTAANFTRDGNTELFEDDTALLDRVLSEDAIVSARNSDLIQLGEDHVVVVRVAAHHEPEPKALEDVEQEIREQLIRGAAQSLAFAAATEFFDALGAQSGDSAELAETYGAIWNAPALVRRVDVEVPAEILAAAFAEPRADIQEPILRRIPLRNGDDVILILSAVEAGQPESLPVAERDQRQQLLADQAGQIEISGYAGSVRDAASVRIPDEVLNPQF
jgi:peptidyl-prolyl cis-trans isomerase D